MGVKNIVNDFVQTKNGYCDQTRTAFKSGIYKQCQNNAYVYCSYKYLTLPRTENMTINSTKPKQHCFKGK